MDVTVTVPDSVISDAMEKKLAGVKPVDPFPQVMDKQQASHFLHCSRSSLDKFIKNDKNFPVVHLGGKSYRFIKSDLLDWLRTHKN